MVDDLLYFWQPANVCRTYGVNMASVTNWQPHFNLLSETIKRTFSVTTQFARGRVSDNLKKYRRSCFPACNVERRNKPVATDTVFSDTPAADSNFTAAQLFVSRHSLEGDAFGLKTDQEFVNTLEDNICIQGAMDKVISDCAKAEMGSSMKAILPARVRVQAWH
jgi:hypothetical protein